MNFGINKKINEALEDSSTTFKIGLILGLVVWALLVIIFWPWCIIFALNTLFPALAISFNFWTWLSVFILNLTYNYKNFYNNQD